MMLPVWVIAMLPRDMQRKKICKRWDSRTDEEIIDALDDAQNWISIISKDDDTNDHLIKLSDDCQMRIDEYIMPQIIKRNIDL